jgi:outer membrane protein assembly factor BamA
MKKLLIFIILCLGLVHGGESGRVIKSIIISGNSVTKEEVIHRELLFQVGDTLNDSLLAASRNRLQNLFLFNRVEIFEIPEKESVTLLIDVTERLYIYPYPQMQIEDRDWDKLTYGFGFAHVNFRGRNEKLYGEAHFGFKPGFKIGYLNPWVGRDLHLTVGFYAKRYISGHRTLDFDERHLSLDFLFGKYWTLEFYSTINLGYDRIRVPGEWSPFMASKRSADEIASLIFQTTLDTRDLYAYPRTGVSYQLTLMQHGILGTDTDYSQYRLDLKQYVSVSDIIFASRFHLLQTHGDLPFYRTIYFGFGERVRGRFNDVFEGKHRFLGSGEVRFPLLAERYFDLPSAVIPASSTQDLKFGLYGALFADAGIVWMQQSEFGINNFLSGYGAGLHFLLPYVEVARLELAFDTRYNAQLIFEVGIIF